MNNLNLRDKALGRLKEVEADNIVKVIEKDVKYFQEMIKKANEMLGGEFAWTTDKIENFYTITNKESRVVLAFTHTSTNLYTLKKCPDCGELMVSVPIDYLYQLGKALNDTIRYNHRCKKDIPKTVDEVLMGAIEDFVTDVFENLH